MIQASTVRVFDFLDENLSDSDTIEKAITFAKRHNAKTLVFDKKDWLIDRAILFYSNVEFIVDGVTIRQMDDTFDNVFRPENIIVDSTNPYGFPLAIKQTDNVKIIGKNGARLEGPSVQAKRLDFSTGEMDETWSDRWGWRGFLVYFTRCENFEFGGFYLAKARSWTISVDRSNDGYFHDIEFYTNCENGDGLNLRIGSQNIKIENLKGTTSDDFIALNSMSLDWKYPMIQPGKTYLYPLVASNYLLSSENSEARYIKNIQIRNIYSKTEPNWCSQAVAFLGRDGNEISNVDIYGVYDMNPIEYGRIDIIGAYYDESYGETGNQPKLKNIRIDTVVCNSTPYAVLFRERVAGLKVNNVTQNFQDGVIVMAKDEDENEIEIANSLAVSGIIQDSTRNFKSVWELIEFYKNGAL